MKYRRMFKKKFDEVIMTIAVGFMFCLVLWVVLIAFVTWLAKTDIVRNPADSLIISPKQ